MVVSLNRDKMSRKISKIAKNVMCIHYVDENGVENYDIYAFIGGGFKEFQIQKRQDVYYLYNEGNIIPAKMSTDQDLIVNDFKKLII